MNIRDAENQLRRLTAERDALIARGPSPEAVEIAGRVARLRASLARARKGARNATKSRVDASARPDRPGTLPPKPHKAAKLAAARESARRRAATRGIRDGVNAPKEGRK